ncbi:MAG: efflux RND transporter periplasmic adaptor subunit [Candidatus Latescibacteria bacterium]|nr:efflux RND transporter periplasmic adaptor subunit [Candidatus Latescibacterota bacterium]
MIPYRDKRLWAGVGVLLLIGVAIAMNTLGGPDIAGIPTYQVTKGPFNVVLFENGEVQAARGEKVVTPRVRGQLKIVDLWPEGAHVETGDLILQFEKSEFEKELRDAEGEMAKDQADLSRTDATQAQQLDDLKTNIAQQEASLELAQLKLRQSKYNTPNEKEIAQINLDQTRRALEQANKDYEVRKLVNKVEMAKIEVRISQTRKNYDRRKKDYDQLTVFAARPGIVVYEKIEKSGGKVEKVKVGDQVWGGQPLLILPDLSAMQVVSQVGEMDVQQVAPGQPVLVRLDAFPGPVFHGKVARIAPMANPQLDAPNVQVFEMLVDIEGQDERLKPGMSASVEIVVKTVPDALAVPLEALQVEEGRTLVYRLRGKTPKPVEVKVGERNAVAAIIDSGLEEGAVVALKPVP